MARLRLAAGPYAAPAACLATVLDRYGRHRSLQALADELGPASAVTAEDMAEVARTEGMTARAVHLSPEQFVDLEMPAIIEVQPHGWRVLNRIDSRSVELVDPLRGKQRRSRAVFDATASGAAVQLRPGEAFTKQAAPGSVRSVLALLPPAVVRGQVWIILLSLVAVVPVILIPLLLRSFVDLFLVAGIGAVSLQVFVAILALALLQLATLLLQNWALVRGGAAVDVSVVLALEGSVLNAPQRFFQERSPYDLAARPGEMQVLGQLVAGQLSRGIAGLIIFLAATVLMIVLSPMLGLLSTLILVVGVLGHRALSQKALHSSQLGSIQRRTFRAEAGQAIDNFETIKSLGRVHALFDRFGSKLAATKTTAVEDDVNWQRVFASWTMVTFVARFALLIVGAQLVLFNQLSIGTLVAVQALLSSQIQPLVNIVQAQEQVIRARSALAALDDVVTAAPAVTERETSSGRPQLDLPVELPQGMPAPTVHLNSISFAYLPRRPLTIDSVSLAAEPGERIAIVGPSGSGKSTIARLLVGLLNSDSGDIDIGGAPRDRWPDSVTACAVGYVSQDVSLFAGTVRENVTMLDDHLTDEQVVRALRDAQILPEIQRRVGGIHHTVKERGLGFSGGQIQRIGIARALVRDPRILVLDEATSALEPTTEFNVDQAIRRRGCTTVVVAHRLSTVRDADKIIVVENGRIVEEGSHPDLVARNGTYHRLVMG